MLIKIKPVPKPRMTRSDKWKKRPAVLRYWQFCDEVRDKTRYLELGNRLKIVFYIKPSESSMKKKGSALKLNKPHDQKPDVDNLGKAILDALFKDDSKVYSMHIEKYWAEEDAIDLEFY